MTELKVDLGLLGRHAVDLGMPRSGFASVLTVEIWCGPATKRPW